MRILALEEENIIILQIQWLEKPTNIWLRSTQTEVQKNLVQSAVEIIRSIYLKETTIID